MSARSMNKVMLIGNLTRDPELKYTPTGTAVCTFGVATNRSWTTVTGEVKEDTQFHRIVAWQKLAELCGKILSKGKKVYLEGRIVYRSFVGKDGVQRTIAEIIMDDFIVFDGGKKNSNNNQTSSDVQTGDTTTSTSGDNSEDDIFNKDISSETTDEKTPKEEDDQKVNPDDIPF